MASAVRSYYNGRPGGYEHVLADRGKSESARTNTTTDFTGNRTQNAESARRLRQMAKRGQAA